MWSALVAIVILILPLSAHCASLRIEGDRAWLNVNDTPLEEVLKLFEQRGVEILVDPSLELGHITGEWENTEIDRLMSQLAGSYSYLLERKKISGPLGEFYQLESIRIYSKGNPAVARPLSRAPRILDVVEGKDGLKYLRGELMIGFKEGSSINDLKALLAKIGGTVIEVIDPPGIYRIRLNEGMTVEKAMEIARAHDGVSMSEPNIASSRISNQPVSIGEGSQGMNLHLQPGETAIAVFDSGLDPRYAGLAVIRGTYDAVDPGADISDPLGHGTLTSLIAAGVITPEGAIPAENGVPVLAIRTFDENGMTSADILMRALEYAAHSGVKIVSMSWGSEVDNALIEAAMNYAAENGMTLFAAAGNEPTGEPVYPAAHDTVIGVGGLNPDGSRWENSNFGDFVLRYEWAKAFFDGQSYAGTSIAAPYAAYRAAQK